MTFVRLTSSLALAFLVAACGVKKADHAIQPAEAVKAPADIRESVSAVPASSSATSEDTAGSGSGALEVTDRYHLAIRKSALEKEFLLSASIVDQVGAPTSTGMRGRVVAFKHVGESVFLLEATQGHVVTRDLPSHLILAEIPVLRETADQLVVDFNRGMRRAYVVRGWYASEGTKTDYDPSDVVKSARVGHSFVDRIEVVDNRLEVRQVAQLDLDEASPTVEVRYFISPYRPDPAFKPVVSSDFTRVGFFEVPPTLEEVSGRSVVRISKWNDARPIVFHVSANTPADYVQAVKEGILYWNKAFGREVLKAELAPEGVTAPDPRFNLIQWVPWDSAGFAYADALMDPRSGEIQSAQAFLTSVFAVGGHKRTRTLLRRFRHLRERAEAREAEGHEHVELGIRFLDPARLCDHDLVSARTLRTFENSVARILEETPSEAAADEASRRLSRDYVRFVTAHEVGHILGLRHNFAGNLAGDLSVEEKQAKFARYLVEGVVPDPREGLITSSVMDYLSFEDDVFVAAQFALLDSAFPYDQQAIRWAYGGRAMTESSPLFCTDSMVGTYADCNRFDIGPDPLKAASHMVDFLLKIAPTTIVEQYIAAKAPADARDRKPLEAIDLKPSARVSAIATEIRNALQWFKKDTRSVAIERRFPYVGEMNADEIRSQRFAWVADQVGSLGGVDSLFFSLLPATDRAARSITAEGMASLDAYLERADVREFTGDDGLRHTLSEEEVAFIRENARVYFEKLEAGLLETLLKVLATSKFEEPSTLLVVEERLGAVVEKIVLDKGERDIEGPAGEDGQAKMLKDFRHTVEVRARAASLLGPGLGALNDWSFETRAAVKTKLVAAVEEILGMKVGEAKMAELPREKRRWLMDQIKVIQQL